MLFTYVKQKRLRVAPAFVRDTIEIILQKPGAEMLHFRTTKRLDRSAEELDAIVGPLIP
jgi:hypothetical protein